VWAIPYGEGSLVQRVTDHLLGNWDMNMESLENVHSSVHSPVSQIATHILCILSINVSLLIWTVLLGPHRDLALRLAVWRMTRATSARSGGGSCSQYSCSSSSRYSLYNTLSISAICVASAKFSHVADWIHCRCVYISLPYTVHHSGHRKYVCFWCGQ